MRNDDVLPDGLTLLDYFNRPPVGIVPESLQNGERGEAMQEAIDALESAVSSCEELDEYLTNATEQ